MASRAPPGGATLGPSPAAVAVVDHSSYANPSEVRITHTDLEIDVDFESRTLRCWARHAVAVQAEGARALVLDSRGLALDSVSWDGGATQATHRAGPASAALGTPLHIALPPGAQPGSTLSLELRWATPPDAVAAQWLDPAQTAGGVKPFLFTQCQAIHARTLVPCQDTPGAKFTYEAAVKTPAGLVALMSALQVEGGGDGDDGLPHVPARPGAGPARVFRFRQPLPISSYLVALAVGDLVSRDLSPISRVWSEPSTADAAAFEFADTPRYLAAAEAIAGFYRWGRYDLLLLPPSFPYGGMENPCLTFVTPTLLAGDRSLANVVAHEVAHSWTGNLVSNASWAHFWLNEGFTVYLERRIMGELEGEASFQFRAARGRDRLAEAVKQWGPAHPYTRLVPDLSAGVDPDDAFSGIPYEKGFYLIYHLETLVGGPAAFLPFFRAYVAEFAARPLTADDFRAFFTAYFASRGVPAASAVDWDTWLHGLGMPPDVNTYDESMAEAAYALARRWHATDVLGIGGSPPQPQGASPSDLKNWSSAQLVTFLDRLGELRSLAAAHPSTTRAMARLYGLDASRNAEVRCAWYLLCIKARDPAVLPLAEAFLGEQGRMKFVRPLYRALRGWEGQGREVATRAFERNKNKYHPVARKMCAVDLGIVPGDSGGA